MGERDNFILQTDSYKWTHTRMYHPNTCGLFAYLSARPGGENAQTVWFGLQYILKRYFEGVRVTREDLEEAREYDSWHFSHKQLHVEGWRHIIDAHGGRIPIRICAAPEGSVIPTGNVLMTVESTDTAVPWIVGHVEGLLEKVWYPMAVATKSWHMRVALEADAIETGSESAQFMLHDFGYRGVTCEEQAKIGGGAHLLNFLGSDTMVAMKWLRDYYGAKRGMAFSVVAAEHSIMTQAGRDGEIGVALGIIGRSKPNQIVSIVADSYDYYRFVEAMIDNHDLIKATKVKLVIRPDSTTPLHRTPEELVLWTLQRIDERIGSTRSATGRKIVPYSVLWGDGLDSEPINKIESWVKRYGFSAANLVHGMGGGLLQKVNRDTNRVAYKTSACLMGDDLSKWVPMTKEPLDTTKKSMGGRLTLTRVNGYYETAPDTYGGSVLQPVFQNGLVLRQESFDDIRGRVTLEALIQARQLAALRALNNEAQALGIYEAS